jgi:phosphoribosyl 1,2-cyclic phosphate phosphodiesterase
MPIRDLRFIILGSGTSAGVPIIGCDCDVCRSDDPRDRRTRCAAAVRFTDPLGDDRVVLIDTSPDLREQVLRENITRCDGIIYTHNHADHVFGLDDVRRFNAVMQAPINLYADRHTMESLQRIYRYIFEKKENVNDSFVATLIPHLIDPDRPLELFGLRFTPLNLLHGRLPVLGFRLDALDERKRIAAVQPAPLPLAYCTDVSAIPPETWPKLHGKGGMDEQPVRVLILDMLRYRHHPTHLTVEQAINIASDVGAERTWFVHMTHDIRHAELDPQLPDGMDLAYDGLSIDAAVFDRVQRKAAD